MRWALRGAPFFLLLSLSALPAAAGSFTLSLPGDSKVTIDSPSRLAFKVTNTDAPEGLSRIALRFPSGYRVTNGSAPPGWTADLSTGAEITFRTSDEAKCTGAIAPGSALVFGVEAVAPPSRSVTPDSLVSAQGEQSCRGVALDPPATLPSWDRLGIGVALAVGPSILGLGGEATVTMTVTNLSTVELADISALLGSTGTGGVARLVGPTPASLALAPGASGRMTWTGRASLGLAPRVVEGILNVLRQVHHEGVGVFLVEQNVQASLALADRGYVLENGRITGAGSGRDLLQDSHVRQAYLGPLALGR